MRFLLFISTILKGFLLILKHLNLDFLKFRDVFAIFLRNFAFTLPTILCIVGLKHFIEWFLIFNLLPTMWDYLFLIAIFQLLRYWFALSQSVIAKFANLILIFQYFWLPKIVLVPITTVIFMLSILIHFSIEFLAVHFLFCFAPH